MTKHHFIHDRINLILITIILKINVIRMERSILMDCEYFHQKLYKIVLA